MSVDADLTAQTFIDAAILCLSGEVAVDRLECEPAPYGNILYMRFHVEQRMPLAASSMEGALERMMEHCARRLQQLRATRPA